MQRHPQMPVGNCVMDAQLIDVADIVLQYAQFLAMTLAAIGCRLLRQDNQISFGGLIAGAVMGFSIAYLALINLEELELSPAKKITLVFIAGYLAEDILDGLKRAGVWGLAHSKTLLKLLKEKG